MYVMNSCIQTADVAGRQHLRSASQRKMIVPRYRLDTYGCWCFAVAGPSTWNSLPDRLRDSTFSGVSWEFTFRKILTRCTGMRYMNLHSTYLLTYITWQIRLCQSHSLRIITARLVSVWCQDVQWLIWNEANWILDWPSEQDGDVVVIWVRFVLRIDTDLPLTEARQSLVGVMSDLQVRLLNIAHTNTLDNNTRNLIPVSWRREAPSVRSEEIICCLRF